MLPNGAAGPAAVGAGRSAIAVPRHEVGGALSLQAAQTMIAPLA